MVVQEIRHIVHLVRDDNPARLGGIMLSDLERAQHSCQEETQWLVA